jgi:hypothetical protein
MEISSEKSDMMEFLRQDQIRSRIIVNYKCLQQINNFKYLGCDIFYQNEKNIQQKWARFAQNTGNSKPHTLNPTLFPKFSTMELYNALTSHSFIWKRNLDPKNKRIKKWLTSQLR